MMDEVTGYLKDGDVNKLFVNLKDQVRDNPLALALVGSGLGVADDGLRHAPHRLQFQTATCRRPRHHASRPAALRRPPAQPGGSAALLVGFPRLTAPTPNRPPALPAPSAAASARARQA